VSVPQWNVGDRIENRYEIHKILRGGMGIVYLVYDHEWREVYAAKTFQDEVFARIPGTADRFMIEARSWVSLDAHQNVVQALLVEKIRGKPFLFLEYVSGGDLGSWIGTPRLTQDLPQVLRFAIQFCDGMSHALSKGVRAHRDIKPQNCLVTQDNILKVTDFGLAKIFDGTSVDEPRATSSPAGLSVHLSLSGEAAGTCTHMAPEQFDDAKHVDLRADVYSFGVMLFQMVKGKLPFVGQTWDEFARLHRTSPAPPLASGQASLDAIVRKCLSKASAERYASFEALREELAAMYQNITGQIAPLPVLGRELRAAELINKGNALWSLGRFEEALASHDLAIALIPESVEAWSNKGIVLGDLGRPEEALACLDRAIAINPRHTHAWFCKGNELAKLGCPQEALSCYDRALDIDARHVNAWHNKGVALGKLGRPDEAIVCHDQALAINPHCEGAWSGKGTELANLGHHKEALACYDRALAINPRDVEAWFNKGTVLGRLKRHQEALGCFDRGLAANPNCAEAWVNNGASLVSLGRYEDALACYDRAISINPQLPQAWHSRGAALESLRRAQEALACYDRVIALNPRSANAWFNKGAALFRVSETVQNAIPCFAEAQRLGHPGAAEAIAICRKRLAN
jgi:tetratricopeptide (TPR) repeat protein